MPELSGALPTQPINRPQRIETLDHIRAFSALLVVLGHALHYVNELPVAQGGGIGIPYFQHGFGAMIFIAMSGFVGYITTINKEGKSDARIFLYRRLTKLVPLYWLFTSLWLAIALLNPSVLTKGQIDPWHVIGSYLFIPVARPFDGMPSPVLSLGWTLNYVILFYIMFFAAILVRKKIRLPAISIAVICIIFAHPYVKTSVAFSFWSDRYILLALVGVYLGAMWKSLLLKPILPYSIGAITVMVACFAAWAILHHGRGTGFSVNFLLASGLSFIVVGVCVITKSVHNKLFMTTWSAIAASSYSLYLSHPFTLGIMVEVWKTLELYYYFNGWFLLIAEIIAAVIIGLLVSKFIEKPISRHVEQFRKPKTVLMEQAL